MSIFSFFKHKKEESFDIPKVENPSESVQKFDFGEKDQFSSGYPQQQSFNPPASPSSFDQNTNPYGQNNNSYNQNNNSFAASSQQNFPSFGQTSPAGPEKDLKRDLELISAKLDTIKAILDSLNQRVLTLEKNIQDKERKESIRW